MRRQGAVHEEGWRIRELHPENPAFEPIVPDPKQLSLLGKMVEVRRYLRGR